jgi:hypothetical protein
MGKSIQAGYEEDFYAWTAHNAKLLKEGKLSEIDVKNIAEEIVGNTPSRSKDFVSPN